MSAGAAGTRARLTTPRVMAAALQVVDSEGLDALTMRRLGQVLDRDPMALYRYAANRAALLDGVAELVLGGLVIPPDTGDWREQLRSAAHDFRRLALEHPNVVPLLVTRPLVTPLGLRPLGTLRPLEQILELLIAAGFAPTRALHVYRTFFGLLHGHVLNELQEVVVDPDESDAVLRLGLHRLPVVQFPRLRSVAPDLLAGYDGAHELDEALDLLLTGLEPVPTQPAAASGRCPDPVDPRHVGPVPA